MPTAGTAVAGALYPKAPLGARLMAFLADGVVGSALLPLGILLVYAAAMRDEASVAGLALVAIGGLWQLLYILGRDGFAGAGFGKRLFGLTVTSVQTGAPIGVGASVVRQLVFYALNLAPVIGSLIEPVMVVTEQAGRRLGDKAAKTQVARTADVAARGLRAPAGKTAPAIAVIAAVLVWLAGSTIGGLAFANAINRAVDGDSVTIETADDTDSEPGVTPETPETEEEAAAPTEQPVPPAEEPSQAGGLNPETATDAVGSLLVAMQNDDVDGMREACTQRFEDANPEFFYGASGALGSFEIVDAFQDAAIYAVVVQEDWISGPEEIMYFVTLEDGQARVDDLAYTE